MLGADPRELAVSWRNGSDASAAVPGAGSTPARNAISRAERSRGGGSDLARGGGSGGHDDE